MPSGSSKNADPAARRVLMARIGARGTRKHVKIRRDLLRQDFDLRVVDSLPLRHHRRQNQENLPNVFSCIALL